MLRNGTLDSNGRYVFKDGLVTRSDRDTLDGRSSRIFRAEITISRVTPGATTATGGRASSAMSATFMLGGLLSIVILIRQVRWLAVIALVVGIGYFAHSRMDYWPHEQRRDHMKIVRP
jgi:hypothetical protein